MDIGRGIEELFQWLFILLVLLIGYVIYSLFTNSNTIKSTKLITPEIRLITDGVKVDTIYIYKQN